jgi:hypothetical protein
MYSRQEASRLNQEFWTIFGQYMSPVTSAEGGKVNWINYKTGEKDVYFRMQANNKYATVAIEIRHKDASMQQIFFEQFLALKPQLENITGEPWSWKLHDHDENGKLFSRVYAFQDGVNIYKKEDWPRLISFFKERIIQLDAFWSEAKYYFEMLH